MGNFASKIWAGIKAAAKRIGRLARRTVSLPFRMLGFGGGGAAAALPEMEATAAEADAPDAFEPDAPGLEPDVAVNPSETNPYMRRRMGLEGGDVKAAIMATSPEAQKAALTKLTMGTRLWVADLTSAELANVAKATPAAIKAHLEGSSSLAAVRRKATNGFGAEGTPIPMIDPAAPGLTNRLLAEGRRRGIDEAHSPAVRDLLHEMRQRQEARQAEARRGDPEDRNRPRKRPSSSQSYGPKPPRAAFA